MPSPADPATIDELPGTIREPDDEHVRVPIDIAADDASHHRSGPAGRGRIRSLASTAASVALHLGVLALFISAPDTAWRLAGMKEDGRTLLGDAAQDRSTPPAVDVAIVEAPTPPKPPQRATPPARPIEPTPKEAARPPARQVLAAPPMEPADRAESVPVEEGPRRPDAATMPTPPVPTPRPAPPRPTVQPAQAADASPRQQEGSGRSQERHRRGAIGGAFDGSEASRATGAAADTTGDAAVTDYPGTIARKLDAALSYPREAQRQKIKGQARVQFLIDASGNVAAVEVIGSSGSEILDQAAIDTVNRAAPFPPIPVEAGRSVWPFKVTLAFGR